MSDTIKLEIVVICLIVLVLTLILTLGYQTNKKQKQINNQVLIIEQMIPKLQTCEQSLQYMMEIEKIRRKELEL